MVGIIFISGCISGENSQSDTQAPNLIIKSDDVPELMLMQYSLIAINNSSPVNFNFNSSNRRREPYEVDGMEYYQDAIKKDMRNIGEKSTWTGKNGQQLGYILLKYDSNSGLKDWFDYMETLQAGRYVIEVGSPQIGDFSIYTKSMGEIRDGRESSSIRFAYKNYYSEVYVIGKNESTFNEATRIAKIIKSRLE